MVCNWWWLLQLLFILMVYQVCLCYNQVLLNLPFATILQSHLPRLSEMSKWAHCCGLLV
jgi:hypothetical protein